jgi:hypothetical protein
MGRFSAVMAMALTVVIIIAVVVWMLSAAPQ